MSRSWNKNLDYYYYTNRNKDGEIGSQDLLQILCSSDKVLEVQWEKNAQYIMPPFYQALV